MQTVIDASGISKSFGHGNSQVRALVGVDFSALACEFVAIMGPSGSGKSTLLSILRGLDLPDEGEVDVNGQSLLGMMEADRAVLRRRKRSAWQRVIRIAPANSRAASSNGWPSPEPS